MKSFLPLSKLEIRKLVMGMKTKTNELDLLPTKFIKENIEKFIGLLTKIVNISLESGVFAKEWKMALLHPLIMMVGLDVLRSNFHPVSKLLFISCFMEYYGLSLQYQSAYRKNHSCETSLLRLDNDSLWAMEQQEATISVHYGSICIIQYCSP